MSKPIRPEILEKKLLEMENEIHRLLDRSGYSREVRQALRDTKDSLIAVQRTLAESTLEETIQ
jgi:hypothetical protein